MRQLDERSQAILHQTPAISVEGVVRRRGFEAMIAGRGIRYERREPEYVILRHGGSVRRVAMPQDDRTPGAALLVTLPLAYMAIRRILRGTTRRRRR